MPDKDLVSTKSSLPERTATTMGILVEALDADQDAEQMETIALTENLLMELGLMGIRVALPLPKEDENTEAYLARVWDDLDDDVQAQIEVTGISRMVSLSKASEKAVQQRLYRQFVTGTWEVYGYKVGINFYRDYCYYVLREAHGLKDTKAGRWADTLQVVGWLYQIENRRRFGLAADDLPLTAPVCIHLYLNRLSRVAARLLHMIAAVNNFNIKLDWEYLNKMRAKGLIHPEDITDQQLATKLYRQVWAVRKLLGNVFSDMKQEELEQSASGSTRKPVDTIYWPEEVPITPAQRSLLERKLGDAISFGGIEEGVRVQYKMELVPCCPSCGMWCNLSPYSGMWCSNCEEDVDKVNIEYLSLWWRRQESDAGMTTWEKCDAPELEGWTPEIIEVVGITAWIFNVREEA